MRNLLLTAGALLLLGLNADTPVRVLMAGDSTMADKPLIDNPEHGWGQMIPLFFSRDVQFINLAKNGRSTKSFLDEGRWDSLLVSVRPGDYVFIQFGHNDAKTDDPSRYADPHGAYKNNLIRFVRDVRRRQGVPVLFTPVNRRNFDSLGHFVDKHGDYPAVVREVAGTEQVPLIDLHRLSGQMFSELGDARSKELFLVSVPPGVYRSLPNGKSDNTHFTRKGAEVIARLAATEIGRSTLPLRSRLLPPEDVAQPAEGIVAGLDQYYNNERKVLKDSSTVRFHYTWEDSADSGFSELARMFDRFGADLDTLNGAPTDASLQRFSIYIIVDPDTPKESASPNVLRDKDIAAIERWVKNGGVLVMMGNDKGNAEFERWNVLAARFGIRFNEDMHQDVRNNQYDSGRVVQFPGHPMFRNVRHAFIKQFSSLTTAPPAEAILETRGVTAIAAAKSGRGMVLAVGDPWLYNEYFDNRRVPAGYENSDAAEGFVRWLCSQAQKVR